jgi:hypothetical protein
MKFPLAFVDEKFEFREPVTDTPISYHFLEVNGFSSGMVRFMGG